MEIDINQKKMTLGQKYQVYIDGKQAYFASREIFKLFPLIRLFKAENGASRMVIEKKSAFFKPRFEITRWDNNTFEFTTQSFWKNHYRCQFGAEFYDIYGHKGRKYSIYKGDTQLAWWSKKAVSWFNGDNYKIIANSDSDYEMLISFCLIIDNLSGNNNGGNMITFDLGNIGLQAKQFDKSWTPND